MASSYPSGLDALTNPLPGDSTVTVSHAAQHGNANDAIEAIQAVLGLNPQGASASVGARCAALESGKASLSGSVSFGGTVGGAGLSGSLLSSASPVMNGSASAGTGVVPSRQDHVHPSDTSRAPTASPTFTGRVTVASGAANGISQSGTLDLVGTGSPEGVVTAPVGSTWRDTNATTGAIKWIKASGTGNTGWVVDFGDTGLRDVSALIPAAHLALNPNAAMTVRRVGSQITIFYTTGSSPTATGLQALTNGTTLPLGFRFTKTASGRTPTGVTLDSAGGGVSSVSLYMSSASQLSSGLHTSGFRVQGSVTYVTDDAWPSTLPGTAA